MDRVTVIDGLEPIVVVAPHGFDDPNTDMLAEALATALNAYAVINHGWERDKKVDDANDKANCNSILQKQKA